MMVNIHNWINEEAWAQVRRWEEKHPGFVASAFLVRRCAADLAVVHRGERSMLASFQGRPQELSPKARYHLMMAKLFPNYYACVSLSRASIVGLVLISFSPAAASDHSTDTTGQSTDQYRRARADPRTCRVDRRCPSPPIAVRRFSQSQLARRTNPVFTQTSSTTTICRTTKTATQFSRSTFGQRSTTSERSRSACRNGGSSRRRRGLAQDSRATSLLASRCRRSDRRCPLHSPRPIAISLPFAYRRSSLVAI